MMDADERQRTQMMIKLTAIEDAKIAAIEKVNLTKRSALTVNEFRSWLNQLIQDKKGALPDLNDWKLIKEQLDNVDRRTVDDDGSGYSILRRDDSECTGFDPEDYAFACGGEEPYDFEFTLDLLDRLCIETESEYSNRLDELMQAYSEYLHYGDWDESVIGCALREDKEYTDGKTKTESDTDTTTTTRT